MITMCRTANLSLLLLITASVAGGSAQAQDRPLQTTALRSSPAMNVVAAATCVPGPTTLCLNNQRFKLDVQWKDFQGGTGAGQAVPLTSDTGYFWFFSSNNVELVVKVLDGRVLNNHFWVFFGALSNVEYTMRVTDTETGAVETYFNPSGQFASVGDTEAFSTTRTTSSAHRYVELHDGSRSGSFTLGENPEQVLPQMLQFTADDHAVAAAVSTCVGTETSLCLSGGRFRLEAKWKDFQGGTGVGKAISLTSDTGYFWFFNSANVELVVKVLDARVINNRIWVFYGALSNVEYEMTVTDTLTGNVNRYSNPSGRFASTGDTTGFAVGTSVVARLDESRAVSADIATTGGTISATAADGAVFTLTVPNGALLSEERITMTPVTSIDSLPLSGGLAAAVDLAPTGLRLFQAATLTIAPSVAVPIAEEVSFAWRGNGEEFFLYPPELGTTNVSMKLMHFSGYGVGRGSAADQAAQQQRVPASPEDAHSQRLQNLLAKQRRQPDPNFAAGLRSELREYYNTVLAAELEIAKLDCPRAKAIFQRALSWSRSVQLLGQGSAFASEIQNITSSLIDALVNCYNRSCTPQSDDEFQEMLSYAKQLVALGAEGRIDLANLTRCGRWDLEFVSVIDELRPYGPAVSWRHEIRSAVPLTFSFLNGPTGNAELVYSSLDYTGPSLAPCSHTSVGTNSIFKVLKVHIDANMFEGSSPPPQALTMEYDPGSPNFLFTMLCPLAPPIILEQSRWRAEYYDHHHDFERFGSNFLGRNWTRLAGGGFARKIDQITSQFAVETTTMTLKLTP